MTDRLALAEFCAVVRRKGALALCLALCTLGLGLSATADEPTIITFDAPGAGTGNLQGTVALAINPAGAITGLYYDASFYYPHGFLRGRDGTITTFDAPGAEGTSAVSINPAGAITGFYGDASRVIHGFLRARDGTFTTFDAPGAVNGTLASSINPAGAITGYYSDASLVIHGFLRAPDGTFTTFDAPGAGTSGYPQGTFASSINPAGAITGYYSDASGVGHGFLRIGTEISLSAPGLTFPAQDVGTTIARPLVVTNEGSVPVSVTSVAATGDFRTTKLCSSIPPHGRCATNVLFKPTQTGLRTGELTITDSDPGSPQTICLTGTGMR